LATRRKCGVSGCYGVAELWWEITFCGLKPRYLELGIFGESQDAIDGEKLENLLSFVGRKLENFLDVCAKRICFYPTNQCTEVLIISSIHQEVQSVDEWGKRTPGLHITLVMIMGIRRRGITRDILQIHPLVTARGMPLLRVTMYSSQKHTPGCRGCIPGSATTTALWPKYVLMTFFAFHWLTYYNSKLLMHCFHPFCSVILWFLERKLSLMGLFSSISIQHRPCFQWSVRETIINKDSYPATN
jgi:hypothetical protein